MTRSNVATALIAMMVLGAAAAAQETARVSVAPGSKLWIDGTSNLHGWTCKAESLDAAIEVDRAAVQHFAASAPKSVKRVEVKVPVKSLKCGHGAMDNNLYKALNADASPDVSYILASFDAVPGEANDSFTVKTVGTLTVAGKENKLEMDVVATRLPDGTLKAVGTVPIKMTDYGIKPPTALFGRLKTGDDVKVNFELTIGGRAIADAVGDKK